MSAILCALLPVAAWMCNASTALAAAEPGEAKDAKVSAGTSQVVEAANAFLATLNEPQRAKVMYRFDDTAQRARWSNFPTGFVPRGGLSLREMSEGQRSAALALVASALSQKGFEKVEQIREADEVFKVNDHGRPPFGNGPGGDHGGPPFGDRKDDHGGPPPGNGLDRDRNGPPSGGGKDDKGRPPLGDGKAHGQAGPPPGGFKPGGGGDALFGKDLYYLAFLGIPSGKDPWMLQFGGHHLALNLTMAGDRGVLTPSLTGAQPATFVVNGQTVRPLGQENDKAFALLNALDANQRGQAILHYRVADLVLGPGHDGETIQPEGLKASALNEAQRTLLLGLIAEWTGIVNDHDAAARLAEIKADLDDTWFAWSGPTSVAPGENGLAYYRIQGPKLVIEYAPQPGEDHVHTMYRDPTNDYGRALTKP